MLEWTMTKHLFLGISGLLVASVVVSTMTVSPAAAEDMKLYRRILSVEDGGKMISFRGEDGKSVVKAKVVEGKTVVEQGAKEKKPIKMSALKESMVCEVSYSGDTASKVSCDPEATE
jgi:hypothetical protein